jgi:RHS repeat-associated protein
MQTYVYIHGSGVDEPLARQNTQSGLVTYYHADGLGSIVATTDATGTVTSTRQYDAWGNPEVGGDQSGYAFTGREWDAETGLYYYRARYYDPKLGIFISEDPIGLAAGDTNVYAYVGGDPINMVDPTGHQAAPPARTRLTIHLSPRVMEQFAFPKPPEPNASKWEMLLYIFRALTWDGGLPGPSGMVIGPENGACKIVSRIKESRALVDEAEATARSVQRGINSLENQLAKGNMNPGIGTKSIGQGISEARSATGARVYFEVVDDTVVILGKSSKHNQQRVIDLIFGKFR